MRKFVSVALVTWLSQAAMAGDIETGPFQVTSLSVAGVAFGGHAAGNFEITGSYTLPSNVCNSAYVTTLRANDPDRAIFAILKKAVEKKLWVGMRVTNDSARTAYPGRCSIVAAGLLTPAPPPPSVTGEVEPPVDRCMLHPEKPCATP